MDQGIWASWYDLPEEARDEYLTWLHEVHIPDLLRRSGYRWAAHVERSSQKDDLKEAVLRYTQDATVPAGKDYLLLIGGVNAHVFFDPTRKELEASFSDETRAMLDLRRNERSNIFAEVARIEGPAATERGPGPTPGPWIQMGSYNVDSPENEDDLSAWYARHMMPVGQHLEGCVGLRKLISVSGWAKHGILYEFADLKSALGAEKEHLLSAGKREIENRHKRVIKSLIHAPDSPTFGVRIWPPAR